VETGEDLRAELRSLLRAERVALAAVLAVAAWAPAISAAVSPERLEQTMKEVTRQERYTWRMPRPVTPAESGPGFAESVLRKIAEWWRAGVEALNRFLEWMFDRLRGTPILPGNQPAPGGLKALTYVLIAAAAMAAALLAYRLLRIRRRGAPQAAEVAATVLDVRDERVTADQLPEGGWLAIARQHMDGGDFRLAMRALYLASLASLAEKELVQIRPWKTNRDYGSELRRRLRERQELTAAFSDNVGLFERTWYGRHPADRDVVERFAANVERLRAYAG
jgi:hypothetical protein